MPELISVSKQEFIEYMSTVSKTTYLGKRLTDFSDGSHGVQYPNSAGTVIGEVIHNREFDTTWRIRK